MIRSSALIDGVALDACGRSPPRRRLATARSRPVAPASRDAATDPSAAADRLLAVGAVELARHRAQPTPAPSPIRGRALERRRADGVEALRADLVEGVLGVCQ